MYVFLVKHKYKVYIHCKKKDGRLVMDILKFICWGLKDLSSNHETVEICIVQPVSL